MKRNNGSPTPTSKNNESTAPTPMSTDSETMAELIRTKFKAAGFSDIQSEAAVANAIDESGLNPNAHNTRGEDSVGLFQMNRDKGLGVGYSVEQLKDPNTNIDLAIAAAKKSSAFMTSNSIDDAISAFVNDVERPANKELAIIKRTDIALSRNPNLDRTSSSRTSLASNNNTGRSVNQQSSFIADAKIFNPTNMMASAFSDMNSLLSALGGNLGGSQNITSINSQLAAANPYDTDMVKLFLESFA